MSINLDRHQDRSTLSVRMAPAEADACRVVAKSSGLPSLNAWLRAVLVAACQPRELSAGEASAAITNAVAQKIRGQCRSDWESGE